MSVNLTNKIRLYLDPYYISHKLHLESMQSIANKVSGIVLDVGCGIKPYKKMFNLATKYYGIELTTYSEDHKEIDWYADGYNLPFENNTFDTIMLLQVLAHIPEPRIFLKELARVIKPDGRIVISTPQTWGLHEIPHDYYRFTPFGLKYLCESIGLTTEVKIKTNGSVATLTQRAVPFWLSFFPKKKSKILEFFLLLTVFIPLRLALFIDRLLGKKGETLYNVMVACKILINNKNKISKSTPKIVLVCCSCKKALIKKNRYLECNNCGIYYSKLNSKWNFTSPLKK